MSEERFVAVQFCDDIRQEVGNKFSMMGCYGAEMFVTDFPVVLPKLCAQVKVFTPIERPFSKLSVRILRGDQVVAEMPFPPEALIKPEGGANRAEARWQTSSAYMVMSPFPIDEPCRLRVEAETDDGMINGGSFWIDRLVVQA